MRRKAARNRPNVGAVGVGSTTNATNGQRPPVTSPGGNAGRPNATRGKKLPIEVPSPEECAALLKACSTRGASGIRNRAILGLMWRSGLRVSEALALFPKDVDLEQGTVNVLKGKGGRQRVVGIDAQAVALLAHWIERRRRLGINGKGRHQLFSTLKGGPIATSYMRQLLPRLGVKAGLEKRCHPHALRHACASELASAGTPINVISAILGHSGSGVTGRYIDHVRPQAAIDALRGREWNLKSRG